MQTLHTTSSTVVEGWSLGLFCSHRSWEPCSHWFDHELLFIHISINIHMRPSVQKLRHGWNWVMLQDNNSSSKSKPEWLKKKKKNQGVATDHWRYRPQLGWNAVTGELCISKCPQKKIGQNSSTTMWETDSHRENNSFKLLLPKELLEATEFWSVFGSFLQNCKEFACSCEK